MSHIPNKLDIKTDLRRGFSASYSPKKFNDENVLVFVGKAQNNLEALKMEIGREKYKLVKARINKAMRIGNPTNKRREDLLTASDII